jgi:hypothetical protein
MDRLRTPSFLILVEHSLMLLKQFVLPSLLYYLIEGVVYNVEFYKIQHANEMVIRESKS